MTKKRSFLGNILCNNVCLHKISAENIDVKANAVCGHCRGAVYLHEGLSRVKIIQNRRFCFCRGAVYLHERMRVKITQSVITEVPFILFKNN